MHKKHYIHRDIKPDNMMMGLGKDSNVVHMIDFGLTRLVIDPKTGRHIPFVQGKNLIGTCRYVSINSHLGYELSRRDDLISVGYVMINFLTGRLPWQGMQSSKPSARYTRVGQIKAQHSNAKLCKDCPPEFVTYLSYVMQLSFEAAPDFNYMKGLICAAAANANLDIFDGVFDWSTLLVSKTEPVKQGPKRSSSSSALNLQAKLQSNQIMVKQEK